jgi:hypothetical protein
VPRISEFYGIVITMFWADHPPPHFHALYSGRQATFDIRTGRILTGSLPRRARRLVAEWVTLHRPELLDNWERARRDAPLLPIEPLT